MQVKTAKAAILAESRKPLLVDEIQLPETLGVGQVLVKVLYSTICGAQLNEIAAAKGPDKFLPHLLGHEASAQVVEVGPGVTNVKPGDTVVLHWRPSLGIQCQPPAYAGFAGFDFDDVLYLFAPVVWLGLHYPFLIGASVGAPAFALLTWYKLNK